MKKRMIFSVLFFTISVYGTAGAEIDSPNIPSISGQSGRLASVMHKKNKLMNKKEEVDTNGYALSYTLDGQPNIIVDDPLEPKCIFYGNYNDGSGEANQYFDIDTVIFDCE